MKHSHKYVDNCEMNNAAQAGLTGANICCLNRGQNKATNYSDLIYTELSSSVTQQSVLQYLLLRLTNGKLCDPRPPCNHLHHPGHQHLQSKEDQHVFTGKDGKDRS